MQSQHEASFAAQAFALQNILQALVTYGHSNAKYLSPKLRADMKLFALNLHNRQNAASACVVITIFETSTNIIAHGAAASFLGYFC